ncbi:MFS transporter [Streptomyces sp. NPDC087420]|uniref:MFS transporter n=1 Tax=Streptomyces sp. NPDC087420 TaxID=3365785 RepID=UPI0038367635
MSSTPTRGVRPRTGNTVLVGLVLAVSMTTIDQTIVALSGPSIQQHLSISHGSLQWAVNVYLLTTAAFFLLGGRLADVLGHRRMLVVGVAAFGITSLLCGLTPQGAAAAPWLIAARALQGVSGAVMFPAALGIVVRAFPQERRGRAMAGFFTVTGAMTAVGPIAGGFLTEWTWRSIFWINVPIALVALILILRTAPAAPRRPDSVDWVGAGVSAAGMGLVVAALQQAGTWGWSSPAVVAFLAVGVLLLVLFVRRQLRADTPLVNLRVFRDAGFTVSTLAMFFASVAFISVFFFLSVYGQVSLGLSATDTGLLFLKFFIGFAVAARLGAVRFDRVGARSVILLGGVTGAAGFVWLARTATDLSFDAGAFLNQQTWPIMVAGAGIGFMFSPVSTDAVNRAIGTSYGEVSALTQTMKNFGGALGLAVFTTVVTQRLTSEVAVSIRRVGGTSQDTRQVVDAITSADGGAKTGGVPSAAREAVLQALRSDYAHAAQVAFYGMALAMAVVAALALSHPRPSGATVTASVPRPR